MNGVVVVGSVNTDFVVSVPRLPAPGVTVIGDRHWRAQGGKGANQAVAAKRAGADVALIGAVGSDDLGSAATAALAGEGIDTRWLRTIEAEPTGVALIMVDTRGENLIAVASGANAGLSPAVVDEAIDRLRPAIVLTNLEVPDDCVMRAALAAARVGARFVLNPAPFRPLSAKLLALVDTLTPNEHEAAELLGHAGGSWGSLFDRLAARGLKHLVVTVGERGAIRLSTEGEVDVPARAVHAIDATGAGDAFNGVLAASLAAGLTIAASVELAVAAGTLATLRHGTWPGLPTHAHLLEFVSMPTIQ